ncbi:hypothetical protein R1sor_024084 [Riccia sorocarpa]|uniref:Uncharacterized protein n=1 Tax=Riccia sorocarpa TaxID=122646 RepID=A0ABD3GQ87_9MARC
MAFPSRGSVGQIRRRERRVNAGSSREKQRTDPKSERVECSTEGTLKVSVLSRREGGNGANVTCLRGRLVDVAPRKQLRKPPLDEPPVASVVKLGKKDDNGILTGPEATLEECKPPLDEPPVASTAKLGRKDDNGVLIGPEATLEECKQPLDEPPVASSAKLGTKDYR